MSQSQPSNFWCFPECKPCKDNGVCPKSGKLEEVRKKEAKEAARKKPDPHAGTVVLPCGCWGLPWPIVTYLGQNLEEIFCDKHGWRKVTKTWKSKAGKQAVKLQKKTTQPELTDESKIPF